MSKEVKLIKRREIRQKGIFDIKKTYRALQAQIKEEKYKFTEKEHIEKENPKGNDLTIIFLAERKFDDFVKFHVRMEFWYERLKDIKHNNKILRKGELKVVFSSFLELDYKNKWNKNAILNFLFEIYTKYIIFNKIDDFYEPKLLEDSNIFYDFIKKELELYNG